MTGRTFTVFMIPFSAISIRVVSLVFPLTVTVGIVDLLSIISAIGNQPLLDTVLAVNTMILSTRTIDDNSVHSTIAVNVNKTGIHEAAKETESFREVRRERRSVRINEDANEYYDNHMRCVEDCSETWFDRSDYEEFRASRRSVIQQALNDQKWGEDPAKLSFFHTLRTLYMATRSVDYILNNVHDALTSKQQAQIQQLYSQDQYLELIGLEYQVCVDMKKDAHAQRDEIQDVVYDIQVETLKGLWSEVEAQTELRDSCLNFSQAAGLFAQLLAQAQLAVDTITV